VREGRGHLGRVALDHRPAREETAVLGVHHGAAAVADEAAPEPETDEVQAEQGGGHGVDGERGVLPQLLHGAGA
jgi:hypothetical protein